MRNISDSAETRIKNFGNVEKLSLGLAYGIHDFVQISKNLPSEVKQKIHCDSNTADFAYKFVQDPFRIMYDHDILAILPEMAPSLDMCSRYMLTFVYCYRISLEQNRETKEFIRKDVLIRMEEFVNSVKLYTGLPRTFIYGILYSNIESTMK